MKLELRVDPQNQWFVSVWVVLNGKKAIIEFKVDTGCNGGLVLSHKELKGLGYLTNHADFANLPNETGTLASGEKSIFKKLGAVSLYQVGKQPIHICNASAICHVTHETNNLIGTEVLRQFRDINFRLYGNRYMDLLK